MNGADILKTLVELLADQEEVTVKYEIREKEEEDADIRNGHNQKIHHS